MNVLFLCLKIFFARILDVSLGTVRTILTIKEKKILSSLFGLFEVSVWFIVVKEALNTDLDSIFIPISYAAGFAAGTYLGGLISEKFISGNLGVQIVTSGKDKKLIKKVRDNGFGVSVIDVNRHDKEAHKYMLYVEINKKRINELKKLIKSLDEKAFIVVSETKYVQNGYIK